ncbi:MAG: hypothetical protein ABJG41_20265 [Cyclobacteriaceae bacterium]
MDNTGKSLAELIERILIFLKSEKITQSEVESQLNYTSLSKAKNFEKYPQTIIEKKTRAELVEILLSQYNLAYDETRNIITHIGIVNPQKQPVQKMVYIMYYYAFARETVGRAIIQITNKKKVTIEYPMNEYWEGTYEVVENYTFIQAEKKGDATPVKKLICLFSGTEKHGRPILMGGYSTVKRDGFPVAGNVVLEKMDSESMLENRLKGEIDPRIVYYLSEKVMVADTFTPNNLDDLNSDFKMIVKYSGKYSLHLKRADQILKGDLELSKTGRATIVVSAISYQGIFKLLDSHTIKIILKDASEFSNKIKEEIDLILKTHSHQHTPYYVGSGISNSFDSETFSFECLALKAEFEHTEDEGRITELFGY